MYRKFNIRDYQNGGSTPTREIEEVEIPLTYNDKVRRYYLKKIKSPEYKDKLYKLGYAGDLNFIERLFKRDYDKVEDLANYRADKIRNTTIERIKRTPVYDENYNWIRPENRSKNVYDYTTKKNTIYLDDNYNDHNALPHEYSHSEVNVGDLKNRLNEKEQKIIQKGLKRDIRLKYKNNPEDPEVYHNHSAYERKADIDDIRTELYINGLHKPGTNYYRTDPKGKWKKINTQKGAEALFRNIEGNKGLERSRKLYNNDGAIMEVMRQISYNNPNIGVKFDKNNYNV